MLKKITLSLLCGLLFLPASLAMAEDGSKVLVTAGDESLTQAEFDQMLGGSPPEIKAMLASQPGILNNFLNRWADLSLLSQAAKREGVDKDPTVQLKIEELTTRVLVEEYVTRNTGKAEVSDEDIKTYYDQHKNEYAHGDMVQAQHILIRVEDGNNEEQVAAAKKKIDDIKARIDKGQTFTVLAQKLSDDPGSKMNGGDLGFFGRGSMVPEFEEAAFATKKGEVSEPVQTQFGWHIIKVTDTKAKGHAPLAEVREQIKGKIQAEKQPAEVENLLANLKKKYPVTIHTDKTP